MCIIEIGEVYREGLTNSAVLFGPDGTLVETEKLKAIFHGPSVAELRPDVAEEEAAAAYAGDPVGRSRREVATTLMDRFGLKEAPGRARTSSAKTSRGGLRAGPPRRLREAPRRHRTAARAALPAQHRAPARDAA